MYARNLAHKLQELARYFRVVRLTGPRQAGKTTLVKQVFSHLPLVTLDDPEIKQQAFEHPREFLAQYSEGAIFDEIQYAPHLLNYLKVMVDRDERCGRFVITGSQNFVLSEQVTQTLAGRVGIATLLPLSLQELGMTDDINERIVSGGYPGRYQLNTPTVAFYDAYLNTYVERDVRQLPNVGDLLEFRKFITLCAARVGQIVDMSQLARDCKISVDVAQRWLTLLAAGYVIFQVPPYFKSFNKRLIKNSKLYFYDTGLVSFLLGISSAEKLAQSEYRGALYENLAILEILKARCNDGLPQWLYFWRDEEGCEIDCIVDWDNYINAFEIKSAAAFKQDFLKNLNTFRQSIALAGVPDKMRGYLVYNGVEEGDRAGVRLVPIQKLADVVTAPV